MSGHIPIVPMYEASPPLPSISIQTSQQTSNQKLIILPPFVDFFVEWKELERERESLGEGARTSFGPSLFLTHPRQLHHLRLNGPKLPFIYLFLFFSKKIIDVAQNERVSVK